MIAGAVFYNFANKSDTVGIGMIDNMHWHIAGPAANGPMKAMALEHRAVMKRSKCTRFLQMGGGVNCRVGQALSSMLLALVTRWVPHA